MSVLSKIHNVEGYKDGRDIKNDVLHYYRRDHLGNVREVWKSGVSGVVSSPFLTVQRMQYYPSGLPWADCTGADYQNRKYNGKEFIEMHGLDEYDSYARWYYPAIMRTTTMDLLCEKYYSISPYAWCGNNPVKFVDPDGREPRIYIQSKHLGHAFVTVREKGETIIYSYGRYGAIGSGGILGRFTPVGEGVLYRKKGAEAEKFLSQVLAEGNFSIFTIKSANDDDVSRFFDNQWEKGTSPSDKSKSSYNAPDARVVDRYDLGNNNCVTKSIEAINSNGQKIDSENVETQVIFVDGASIEKRSKIISPSSLKRTLKNASRTNPNIIMISNPEEFVKNLRLEIGKEAE